MHVALLGDSTFDNGAYTQGEPDVVGHLRTVLPPPWRATLCAIDGSVADRIVEQLEAVPADASHLVISVGGNDALSNLDLLSTPVRSSGQALALVGDRVGRFESSYRSAVEAALRLGLETTVCTIYNGNLVAEQGRLARVALMTFNDAILRVAIEHGLSVIDLRSVCATPADYANPIEPSGQGGRKIARAVAAGVGALPASRIARVVVG